MSATWLLVTALVAALVFPWQGPELTLQILLIGTANGAIVALIALGYTLVYGIIELINFAHGEVFMIGTMTALTIITAIPAMLGLSRASQLDPPLIVLLIVLALVGSMLVCALLNAAIERLAYRRLAQRAAPRAADLGYWRIVHPGERRAVLERRVGRGLPELDSEHRHCGRYPGHRLASSHSRSKTSSSLLSACRSRMHCISSSPEHD